MRIGDIQLNADLNDILAELVNQLRLNGSKLLQKQHETATHIQVCCPYHNNGMERRPSAGIRKSDGLFHCFACGEVHSLPEFISHCFGETDPLGKWGYSWLLKNFATVAIEERTDIDIDLERTSQPKEETVYISEEELDSYRYTHPYMYKRRLTDEIIEKFDIGYDKNTQCITFPVRNIGGNTLFIARRSVKTKFFNYPKGVEKPLYGLYEIYKSSRKDFDLIGKPFIYDFPTEVIVCESMLDALTVWVYGKYAVALNGLGNELQFKQLRELPCRKLILATDADEAGIGARERIRKAVNNKIITEYVWDRSMAKDINEMTEEQFNNLSEIF